MLGRSLSPAKESLGHLALQSKVRGQSRQPPCHVVGIFFTGMAPHSVLKYPWENFFYPPLFGLKNMVGKGDLAT